MFNNSGGKLKTVAKVFAIILMVVYVIVGFVVMAQGSFLSGLISIVVGLLSAWLMGLSMYASGQAAESAENCEAYLQRVQRQLEVRGK